MNEIVTDDIFSKAARAYCRRIGVDPNSRDFNCWGTHEENYRKELELLCEKILALKDVGAI